MPNIKSAKKRVLVNAKKAEQNKAIRSAVKTEIKKVILNKDAWQIFFNENTNKLYTVHFNLDESEDDTNVQYYEYDLKII